MVLPGCLGITRASSHHPRSLILRWTRDTTRWLTTEFEKLLRLVWISLISWQESTIPRIFSQSGWTGQCFGPSFSRCYFGKEIRSRQWCPVNLWIRPLNTFVKVKVSTQATRIIRTLLMPKSGEWQIGLQKTIRMALELADLSQSKWWKSPRWTEQK